MGNTNLKPTIYAQKQKGRNILLKKMIKLQGKKQKEVTNKEEPSVQFSSVAQSCPTLCDPMNRSTPGLPVHHQLPEFTQTHVYRVSDAIQPSHPLSSPSLPAPIPPSIRVFSNESTLCMRWPKYWSFSFSIIPSKEIPGLVSFRMDWLDLLAVHKNNQKTSNKFSISTYLSLITLNVNRLNASFKT